MTLPLTLSLTSDTARLAEGRRAAEAAADAAGLDERAAGEVGLAVNEALANIIRHAYAGEPGRPIELSARVEGDTLIIEIRDHGSGEMPDEDAPHTKDDLIPGGLGLRCMRGMMDRVEFTPQPGGMLLTMTKQLPAGGGPAAGGGYSDRVSESVDLESELVTEARLEDAGDGQALVVVVEGEIDLHNSPDLRGALLGGIGQHKPNRLVLDMGGVPYMDSSALAVIVEALHKLREHDGKIYLVNLTDRVRGLLEIARLDTIFTIADDVDAALKG